MADVSYPSKPSPSLRTRLHGWAPMVLCAVLAMWASLPAWAADESWTVAISLTTTDDPQLETVAIETAWLGEGSLHVDRLAAAGITGSGRLATGKRYRLPTVGRVG